MTDAEFDKFLAAANAELREKQAALTEEFALGEMSRWWFEQQTGKLQFFDKQDRLAVEAEVIDIGSYSPTSNTWKWAWGNESVLPWLRQKAETLKTLEDLTGFELFACQEAFAADEAMAWELAAIAVKHLRAKGCYRAPATDGPWTFLAITNIEPVSVNAP